MKSLLVIAVVLTCWIGAQGQARTAEQIVSIPFSRLNEGTPPNGSIRHVVNGTQGTTPCTGGGSGAMAIRVNGVWHCPRLSVGTGTGDVGGPASSGVGEVAIYSDNTGKNIGRSSSLTGIASLNSGILTAVATTGSGSVVLSANPSITGLNATTVFSSGVIPPARIISNTLTPNTCLRLSSTGTIETAAADCGVGGGGGTPGGVTGNLQYNDAGVLAGLLNSSYSSATGTLTINQQANTNDTIVGLRATDSSPTGTWLRLRNLANTSDLFSVNVTGQVYSATGLLVATTAAPATPASGNTILWTDLTDKNLKAQDDTGQVTLTVRATACSGTDKVSGINSAGIVTCTADQGGTGTGVITLNTLNTSDQSFVAVDDANIDLSIASSVSTHTFTVSWVGTLAKARQHAATVYVDAANVWTAGAQSFAAATSLTVPTAAGATPTTSGELAYDPTSNTLEAGVNGINRTIVFTAGSQTFTDKTLDNSTTATLRDSQLTLQDNADSTKTANFELSGITGGQNRVITVVDAASMTVRPTTATANQWVTHVDSSGTQQKAQPTFANISGTMGETQGGTGQTAYAQGDLLYASTTNILSRLPKSATATRYLSNTGSSNNPAWAQVDLSNGVTGTLADANLSANVSLLGSAIDLSGAEATGTLAAGRFPALSGDVTTSAGSLTAVIASDAVTNTKLANMATATLKGRSTAGTGDPEDLTGTQATTLLNIFTTTLKGLVPAPVTTTNAFLRDDGTWVIPSGAGDTVLAATQTNTGAKTFNDGTLILSGGDYGATDASLPASPAEKAFYLNTNTSSRRLFIYNNAAYREIYQAGLSGPISVPTGGTGLTAGTSGGVPYFSSSTTMASSAALTANLPVIGGGAGTAPTVGTRSGNTTAFVTTTGTLTSGRCAEWDANGNLVQAAAACSSGGSGTPGGSDTQVQFNDSGAFGGDAGLTYNKTTDVLTIAGSIATGASGAGYLEMAEGVAPSAVGNRVTVAAPTDVQTAGWVLSLPTTPGTSGQFLQTNGSGVTVWATPGGSGTVTATGGSLTADAVVLGAGTTDTKVIAGITTDGISKLNLGVTGTSVGSIGFSNATSGTITVQSVTGALGTVTLSLPARTATVATTTGAFATDDCAKFDANGNIISAGAVCGSGGGANTALSNLASVAVNTSLVSDTDLTDDLGTSSIRWRDIYTGGVVVAGKTLIATVDQAIMSLSTATTLAKNDTNAHTLYSVLFKPTLNTGGSNANTTLNVLSVDTINTSTTGLTTNLLNLAYGGVTKFKVGSDGTTTIGSSGTGVLGLADTDASHFLNITPGSNLTADRTLTITTGDANRVITLTGDLAMSGAFNLTLTTTGTTNVTLPTTGTLVASGGDIGAGTATTPSANDNDTSIATTAYVQTELTAYASDTKILTNTTVDPEATGNVVGHIAKVNLWAAGCQNTSAASFWDLPTSTPAVAACVTGTNTQKGVLQFADTSGGFSAQNHFELPEDFTGAIDAKIIWRTSATSGSAKWSLSTICTAVDATETDDPAFNAASTVTTAAPGVANRLQTSSITSVTITGCAAGEVMHVRLFRDGNDAADTLSATAEVLNVQLTIRRSQ